MGIGLTAQNFKSNRLPGWDKQSYGYHGDDGNSFSSSGNGKSYGPTFTTDDIIGCGVNLVTNSCFYTKNGHNLGVAFQDLPVCRWENQTNPWIILHFFFFFSLYLSVPQSKLYPTVGLQTPGEIVDANFGQEPFVFDIEDMLKEMRESTKASIQRFPLPDDQGDWPNILNKWVTIDFTHAWPHTNSTQFHKLFRMVSAYLVHHGYSSTAESFAKATEQTLNEDMSSIRTRQSEFETFIILCLTLQKLILFNLMQKFWNSCWEVGWALQSIIPFDRIRDSWRTIKTCCLCSSADNLWKW